MSYHKQVTSNLDNILSKESNFEQVTSKLKKGIITSNLEQVTSNLEHVGKQ